MIPSDPQPVPGEAPAVRALRRVSAAPLAPENLVAFATALGRFGLDARGLADLEAPELEALAARALRAGGEAVTQVSADDDGRVEHVVAVVRSPPLRRLARSGIVRPGVRHPSAPAGAWAVNVDRLCGDDAASELDVRHALGDVLAELAGLWGNEGPLPALALDGLGRLARRLAGPRAGAVRVRRVADDLLRFCEEVLDHRGSALGWARAPEVLRLDLAG